MDVQAVHSRHGVCRIAAPRCTARVSKRWCAEAHQCWCWCWKLLHSCTTVRGAHGQQLPRNSVLVIEANCASHSGNKFTELVEINAIIMQAALAEACTRLALWLSASQRVRSVVSLVSTTDLCARGLQLLPLVGSCPSARHLRHTSVSTPEQASQERLQLGTRPVDDSWLTGKLGSV